MSTASNQALRLPSNGRTSNSTEPIIGSACRVVTRRNADARATRWLSYGRQRQARPYHPAIMEVVESTRDATALQHGAVEAIHVHPAGDRSQPMVRIEQAVLEAGTGIRGDRDAGPGIPRTHITFIAPEGVEAMVPRTGVPLAPAETRRNGLT